MKNGSLTPRQVVAGTRRKVWWRCGKDHEWQAAVSARAMGGAGCPVCAGKKVLPGENDLASQFPEVAAQWNEEKNGALTPDQVSAYSNRRVWWTCERGHAWQASVAARVKNHSGCPYCTGRKALAGFNDLATVEPQVAAQWHPTLNGAELCEGVVAVPGRPHLEGGHLRPGGAAENRLSGVRGKRENSAHGAVYSRPAGAYNQSQRKPCLI